MYDGDASRAQIPSTDNDALLSDDYTFDDIISYLEYLKSLQALESRLKQQLAEESLQLGEDQEMKEETTADTEEEEKHIRKRRSIGNDGEILHALSLLSSWLCCKLFMCNYRFYTKLNAVCRNTTGGNYTQNETAWLRMVYFT